MRDLVAMKDARLRGRMAWLVRASLFLATVPMVLLALAQQASAAPAADEVVTEQASFDSIGAVGVAAVVAGFGGLVVGLLRRRRRVLATRRAGR